MLDSSDSDGKANGTPASACERHASETCARSDAKECQWRWPPPMTLSTLWRRNGSALQRPESRRIDQQLKPLRASNTVQHGFERVQLGGGGGGAVVATGKTDDASVGSGMNEGGARTRRLDDAPTATCRANALPSSAPRGGARARVTRWGGRRTMVCLRICEGLIGDSVRTAASTDGDRQMNVIATTGNDNVGDDHAAIGRSSLGQLYTAADREDDRLRRRVDAERRSQRVLGEGTLSEEAEETRDVAE